jgi:hypothetical protein
LYPVLGTKHRNGLERFLFFAAYVIPCHAPPTRVEVQNAWNFSSSLLYAFVECCLATGTSLSLPFNIVIIGSKDF